FVRPVVTFTAAFDPTSLRPGTVRLVEADGTEVPLAALAAGATARELVVSPARELAASTDHELLVDGGLGGIRDLAGNLLAGDARLGFTTLPASAVAPVITVWPADDALGVAVDAV